VPVRLHARIATTEMTIAAALTNREFGQPAFFLLTFDARKLRTNQRTVNGTFLDVRRDFTGRVRCDLGTGFLRSGFDGRLGRSLNGCR
jgi:hypothetical protein